MLDCEFADDTTLYVVGDDKNLCNVQNVIHDFYDASGAIINWHKSVGFWVGKSVTPTWCPDVGFRWVPKGFPVRYLGCQVGINLPLKAHIQPLLISLRKKLIFWSSKSLSLAGRLVISNQVLLSSMWYILSSWLFSRSLLSKLQRLIRNFLWGSTDFKNVRPKVAWKTIIVSTSQGGLGLVDPLMQCKTLLENFVVRGLLLRNEPWKLILQLRMKEVFPKTGGEWTRSIRWWFITNFHSHKIVFHNDRFFATIKRA